MTNIGEFRVDFELYEIAEVMKQLDAFDKEMQESKKQMEKNEKQNNMWAKSFKRLHIAAIAAFAGMYYQIMKTSPAIQAHLGSIGIALDLVGMTIGEAISPLFEMFEDMTWAFAEWFMDLDEGTQKAIGYAIAIGGIVAIVTKLAGLKWGLFAGGVALLAIAYAENFGSMQENVTELWKNIKDKDWAAAWDTLKKTVKDLWSAILPHWEAFRDSLFTWAETETWGDFTKVVMEKIKTKFSTVWNDYVKPEYEKLRDKIFEWADAENWGDVAIKIMSDMWKETEALRIIIYDATKWIGKTIGSAIWDDIKENLIDLVPNWLKDYLEKKKYEARREVGAPMIGELPKFEKPSLWETVKGLPKALGYEAGGYISHTGLHMMHAGEQVIPSGIAQTNGGGLNGGINVTNNNIFYGNMGDRHTMTQNINDMTQTMKTSLKQYQSTSLGGRF